MGQIELFAACGDDVGVPPHPDASKTRARPRLGHQRWGLEDHVCRRCFGRLVSSQAMGGYSVYRCTNCGTEVEGRTASVLCACGLQVKDGAAPGTPMVDAGLRCVPNPSPTAAFPSQIVAAERKT